MIGNNTAEPFMAGGFFLLYFLGLSPNAGIHCFYYYVKFLIAPWIPAYAGMTIKIIAMQ